MHPADPPQPLPDYLQPDSWTTPLGEGDLRVAPSTEELRVIAGLLDHEHLSGQCLITQRDGSPWLELAVAVPYHLAARDATEPSALGGHVYKYAIWRYTCRAYRVGEDGAVEDDPFYPVSPA